MKKRLFKKILFSIEEIKKNKWGALLVFERENSLKNVVSDAVPMHASFSPELLVSIFNPSSPLHDGAVVIHNNLIEAAACILPLTESKTLNPETVSYTHLTLPTSTHV